MILKIILVTGGWGISCKIALRWMPLDITDDKSTLLQVMAWCRQATGHYLSQCWQRFMSPYGVTGPQWVNFVASTVRVNWYEVAKQIENTSQIAHQVTIRLSLRQKDVNLSFGRDNDVNIAWDYYSSSITLYVFWVMRNICEISEVQRLSVIVMSEGPRSVLTDSVPGRAAITMMAR